jgi:hypothetical protein
MKIIKQLLVYNLIVLAVFPIALGMLQIMNYLSGQKENVFSNFDMISTVVPLTMLTVSIIVILVNMLDNKLSELTKWMNK